MALFGFSDITFSKGVSERTGPLADLVSNQFKTTTLRYPLDVGNADKAPVSYTHLTLPTKRIV